MDYDDKYQGSKIPRPNVFDRIEAEMSMDSLMQEAQPEPEPATRPELEPELEFETEKEPDPASNQVAEEAKQGQFRPPIGLGGARALCNFLARASA